jgi:hypothetical protein
LIVGDFLKKACCRHLPAARRELGANKLRIHPKGERRQEKGGGNPTAFSFAVALEPVAFTCVHATRSTSLFFEHLHTFRFSI